MTPTNKVIVTGARGFLGREICRLLSGKVEIFSVQRESSDIDLPGVEVVPWEHDVVRFSARVQEISPNSVIHLAALYRSIDDPSDLSEMVDASVLLTGALMFGLQEGNGRLVLAGTRFQRLNEGNAISVYASMKSFQRQLALQMSSAQVEVAHLEVGDVYGLGDTRDKIFSRLKGAALTGVPISLAGPENLIYPVHVSDAAKAFIAALSPEIRGNNDYSVVGVDGSMTVMALARVFEEKTGSTFISNKNSDTLGKVNSTLMEPLKLPSPIPGWSPEIGINEGVAALLEIP